ncbi:hypothetical protein [Demequina lutea]|uniref:DUF8094 domain-containing protein n=1 Tax=Demequina lutea TaxID=431489 RepID=A0A7Z0CKW0_9MICO|nr:hypothetical protein [Demequina lutea]NYI42135.1 hypothetical protein [Demequina lutea]
MRRSILVSAALVTAALSLSACAAAPPIVGVTPSPAAKAALLDTQAKSIIDDTFTVLAVADKAQDASLLDARFEGDAVAVRAAEYAVAKAVADAPVSDLPSGVQGVYVSNAETWPRVLAAVSDSPSDKLTPVVYLWVQDSIQVPYTLRAWAHMIPGATLPAMAGSVDGATQLALGETGVDPSPRAALENYVEFLRQGADSKLAADFTPDSYSQQLFTARTALASAAASAGGAYVDTVQPDLTQTYVLSTSDGGALVFAPVQISSSFSVSGATLKVSDRDAPLVQGTIVDKATYLYRDLVVLSVPAPGLNQIPSVVAAEHHLVSVKPE